MQNLPIAFMQVAAMTSINLVSRPLPRELPAFAHGCVAFNLADPERAGILGKDDFSQENVLLLAVGKTPK